MGDDALARGGERVEDEAEGAHLRVGLHQACGRVLAQREAAPLKHLDLPDDLFDHEDAEQAAIGAGEYSDGVGIWRGPPKAS